MQMVPETVLPDRVCTEHKRPVNRIISSPNGPDIHSVLCYVQLQIDMWKFHFTVVGDFIFSSLKAIWRKWQSSRWFQPTNCLVFFTDTNPISTVLCSIRRLIDKYPDYFYSKEVKARRVKPLDKEWFDSAVYAVAHSHCLQRWLEGTCVSCYRCIDHDRESCSGYTYTML